MMVMNFKFRVPNFLKSVRHSLAFVNSVFLATGLLLLFVGIAVLVRYTEYDELIRRRFFNLPWFVIGTGIVILLGSVLGLHATISRCFYVVAAYEILLLVVLGCEIAIITLAFSLYNDAVSSVRISMWQSLQQYGTNIETTLLWDQMQNQFKCCGAASSYDWISSQLPVSCCSIPIGSILSFECSTLNAYSLGCASVLGEYLAHLAYVMAICASVVCSIQVILVSLAACFTWRVKHDEVKHDFFEPEIPSPEPPNPCDRRSWLQQPWRLKIGRKAEKKKPVKQMAH